ncbi:ABC transporter substrate-binding protein [Affinibrenneria salicis]|uniref:Thiamine pyrimidine synthase n=1 Tax=Affinibrenneria salicis TaxID=2590031 RepID=A0A5J5FS61_9GAMM|nr:ABC transporter substrate-binding protein [Affinibrenneria salicis]KAA8996121.1 ABC transporter substrate-binding protein [Affinibrenneria salicis]
MIKIKLMLEYFHPWPNSAGYYVARENHFYSEQNLDVEIVVGDPHFGDALSYLQRKEVTFGVFPSNRLLVRRAEGQPLKGVAAINHTGLESIQTLAGRGISRPRDLEGKRLALNPTPRGVAMVRHLVRQDGGDPDKLIFIDSGVRELTPEELKAGIADASFGGYWAWEALMSSSVPDEERVVMPVSDHGAPPYHSYLLGAHEDTLANSPDVVRRFIAATSRGYYHTAAHPEEALRIFEKTTPYFPSDLLSASLNAITPTWFHQRQWGIQRESLLQPYAQWLHQNGIINHAGIWRDATTNRFLPEVTHVG